MIEFLFMRIKQLFFRFFIIFLLSDLLFGEARLSFEQIMIKYAHVKPTLWGDDITGVVRRIHIQEPYIFLTLDACSGGLDSRIIDFLNKNRIPAVIFVNARWIDKHKDEFLKLASNKLFSIQNHGSLHKPLSMNGRSVYHIEGTKNLQEAYNEVMYNDSKIFELIGKYPRFFRSGTAYYDDVALLMLRDTGYIAVGYDVLGDGGATFSKDQMIKQADLVRNGSILIYHLNHPEKTIYDALKEVVIILQNRGFVFKKLDDFL